MTTPIDANHKALFQCDKSTIQIYCLHQIFLMKTICQNVLNIRKTNLKYDKIIFCERHSSFHKANKNGILKLNPQHLNEII